MKKIIKNINNAFSIVKSKFIIYFQNKGGISPISRQYIPLNHCTSIRKQIFRGILLFIIGMKFLGISWQNSNEINYNHLSKKEVIRLFPEYQNIKEISISNLLVEGTFIVEFWAEIDTVLHPKSFIITKK